MKLRWLSTLMVLALAVIGLTANVAYSQGTTGDIEGTVIDSNGAPLPGASVEIRSPSLQGTRTAVTDAAGRFRFPAIPPGVYTVTAALSGFTKIERTNVRVGLGATATLPITMSVSVKEEIVVTGEAPVIDTTKTVIGMNTTAEALQKLPLARNFTSIAFRTPGTGTDAAGGVTVYGATSLENQYVIDGLNTSAIKGYDLPQNWVGAPGLGGNAGKALNMTFVQEVEVKTGGYEAEYGRALGGVVNVITKSGGNEFHGDVFANWDNASLAAKDAHSAERQDVGLGAYSSPARADFGADLGGYFVKDVLWFFGAYDRLHRDQVFQRIVTARDPNDPTSKTFRLTSGGYTTDRNNLFSGKLTGRLGESNTLALSVIGDPSKTENVPQQGIGPDSVDLAKEETGATDFTAKWDGIFGTRFLAQAQFGLHQEKNDFGPADPAAATRYALQKRQSGFLNEFYPNSGFDSLIVNEKYKRYNYKLAGTLFFGGHEVKLGGDYEQLKSTFDQRYPGPATGGGAIREYLSGAGNFRFQYNRFYGVVPVSLNCLQKLDGTVPAAGEIVTVNNCAGYRVANSNFSDPDTRNVAFFAQDSWKILRNLTANVGIRYEEQRLKNYAGDTVLTLKNEWSPRLGLVWDFLNNGKSKAYGSFGRYYTTIPQDLQTRSLGREALVIGFTYTPTQTLQPIDESGYPAFAQTGDFIGPDVKGMYQDEVIAGIEYEFLRNWSFGVKGIYKKLGRVVEDRCDLLGNPDVNPYISDTTDPYIILNQPTCALINVGGNNSALDTIKDPADKQCYPNGPTNEAGQYVASAPCTGTGATRVYRGIQVDLAHRFSQNFFLQSSYIYSKLEGNYNGNLSQTRETGQLDPNINADFDYPGLVTNSYGRLRNDRKHQIKVTGYYVFPFGLSAGGNFTYTSGRPRNLQGCPYDHPSCASGYDQEGFILPKGTFGDMPSIYEGDLHLEYALRFGSVSFTPAIDIFNIFNRQSATSRNDLWNNTADAANNGPDGGNVGVKPGCTAAVAAAGYNQACSPNANWNKDIQWQLPRSIRIGGRVSF